MAETLRFIILAAACFLTFFPGENAHAFLNFQTCQPQSPEPLSNSPIGWLFEDPKKLSQDGFLGLPITPTGSLVIPKETELNVVVDPACLIDPERGPRGMPLLQGLRSFYASVSVRGTFRSVHWKADRDYAFQELQAAFEQEPCVTLVSPEREYYLNRTPSDPFISGQPHLERLGYQKVYSSFLLPMMVRRPVVIGVIDTGVDFTHPDLKLNKWINLGEIPDNGIDDDRNGYVDDVNGYHFAFASGDSSPRGNWDSIDHGTHVAGLASARFDNGVGGAGLHGVAKLMSLAVFDDRGFSRSSLVENAIRYAADQGAELINLSLGGNEYSRSMKSALQYAINRGVFIVAASGNFHLEICDDPLHPSFVSPAAYGSSLNGMIVVSSVDVADGRLSSFSNYSKRLIDIAAPGAVRTGFAGQQGLLSTSLSGGYSYHAGTSMSAPLVTGASALALSWLKAHGYDTSPARLETIMKSAARTDEALAEFIDTGRVLNLESLLCYLQTAYPPKTPLP